MEQRRACARWIWTSWCHYLSLGGRRSSPVQVACSTLQMGRRRARTVTTLCVARTTRRHRSTAFHWKTMHRPQSCCVALADWFDVAAFPHPHPSPPVTCRTTVLLRLKWAWRCCAVPPFPPSSNIGQRQTRVAPAGSTARDGHVPSREKYFKTAEAAGYTSFPRCSKYTQEDQEYPQKMSSSGILLLHLNKIYLQDILSWYLNLISI